jgi:glutathione peroxidase-family protein
MLIVNVASRCGNTPRSAQLEELQHRYADKGFTGGEIVARFRPDTLPDAPEVVAAIEALLPA